MASRKHARGIIQKQLGIAFMSDLVCTKEKLFEEDIWQMQTSGAWHVTEA